MIEFRGYDRSYLDWITADRGGWVVNAGRNPKPRYLQLHKAWCPTISDPQRGGAYTERDYVKFCAVHRQDLDAYFLDRLEAKPRWNCTRCG